MLCGSYVSFVEREVLAHKSPLYGRRTGQLLATLRAAEGGATELTPTARALLGVLRPAGADEVAYRRYLEKKYR